MEFATFVLQIFSFFATIFQFFVSVFNLLITNNYIKFSLCLGIVILIIDYQFDILGAMQDIFGFSGMRDRELRDSINSLNSNISNMSGGSYQAVFDKKGNARVIKASYYGKHRKR